MTRDNSQKINKDDGFEDQKENRDNFFELPITVDEEDEDGIVHRGLSPDPESFNELESGSYEYFPHFDEDNEDSD